MQRVSPIKWAFTTLAVLAFLAGLGQARADTPVSWANPSSSGNWSDAANWTPAVSPNGAYSVTLPTGSETITLDISPTIDGLTLDSGASLQTDAGVSLTTGSLNNSGGIFFLSGGNLTANGVITNSNNFYAGEGTTVSLANNVSNSGTFYAGYAGGNNNGNGTVTVTGTFDNTGALALNNGSDVVNVNALVNQGTVNVGGGSALNVTGGGPGVTDVAAGTVYALTGSFSVINGGVTTSAIANLASVEGTLVLQSGQTYDFGPLTNSNSFYTGQGTTVSVAGNVTNSGTFYAGYAGGNNNGNGTVTVTGTFDNTGALALNNGSDVVSVNTLVNQGTVNVGGGALLGVGSGSFAASSGYQQLANGTFDEIIGGAGTYGVADIDGPMTLNGTLDVTLDNGFTPTLGESFTFLDGSADDMSGDYASVVGQPFSGGQWQVTYDNAAGTVTLTAITAIPEPASLTLLGVAGFMMLRRRRA
jgi:hypothetical protein